MSRKSPKKKSIYCGNNKLHDKKVKRGTRYECLQKGIGVGLHSDISNWDDKYEPIDTRKIYCGNESGTPNGYAYTGNAPMCLQKGIGIGKKLQNEKRKKRVKKLKKSK